MTRRWAHRRSRRKPRLIAVEIGSVVDSTCCGHAPERRPDDPPCGCVDVELALRFRARWIASAKVDRPGVVVLEGEVTLAPNAPGEQPTFQGRDWSWAPTLLEAVDRLGWDDPEDHNHLEREIVAAL